jgi:KDO2-lipid IV(A) lauroyltransferase
MIVTSHFGNFEISGYLAGLLGFPSVTVARPLDNRFLQQFIAGFRAATGQSMISSRGSAQEVEAALRSGATLAVLGDHYGGPKGCWVQFLNRPASCHKSIGLLALSHQVPLLVFSTRRRDRMLHFEMVTDHEVFDVLEEEAPRSVTDVTQWYTTRLERVIRQCPEQYWWLHRRWKDTRPERQRQRQQKRQLQRPHARHGPTAARKTRDVANSTAADRESRDDASNRAARV